VSARGETSAPLRVVSAPRSTLRFGDCELDFERSELRRAGALVELQATPLRLLLYLAEHRDRTVPKQELLDAIWPDAVVGDASLAKALVSVREALGDDGDEQRVIRTLRGQGVRFVAEIEPEAEPSAPRSRRATAAWLAAALALVLGALAAWLGPTADPSRELSPFGVAVLPIRNLTASVADRELADGLTEQITQTLATHGYPVVARSTAELWRKRAADVRELGAMLGVSHVLEGSVRRDGDRVRITMQLAATDTGTHAWAETFEEANEDLFAVQDRVTDRVANAVHLHVSEDAVALKRDPELARVSDLLLEWRRLWFDNQWEDQLVVAERLLAVAPEREPFVRLRADTKGMMAFAWANLYSGDKRSLAEAGPKMMALARQSVAEAPDSPIAHSALARVLQHYWRWQEFERESARACELAPRSGLYCGAMVSNLCSALGCVERQLEHTRAWHAEVPANPAIMGYPLAWALVANDRLDEALRVSRRAKEIGGPIVAGYLTNLLWRLGERSEAVEAWRDLMLALDGPSTAREFARIGASDPEAAWRWAAEQQAAGVAGFLAPNSNHATAAITFAEVGDLEAALRELERSVAEHEPAMETLTVDPILDPLRETPRFRALIEKMGLTAYHAKYLKRPGTPRTSTTRAALPRAAAP
jgi:TolB-like protein/DNA-binding winged helix-turn-helix (wHTH) protein